MIDGHMDRDFPLILGAPRPLLTIVLVFMHYEEAVCARDRGDEIGSPDCSTPSGFDKNR